MFETELHALVRSINSVFIYKTDAKDLPVIHYKLNPIKLVLAESQMVKPITATQVKNVVESL